MVDRSHRTRILECRSFQATDEAFAALVKVGVVKTAGEARRNRAFESPELLKLVTEFERDLGTSAE